MSHGYEKPHRPKTVYVKAHKRRKPSKTTTDTGRPGLNPKVFQMIVEHENSRRLLAMRYVQALCQRCDNERNDSPQQALATYHKKRSPRR